MGIIAEAVRHLMAAGITGDALVAAVADMEAAQKPPRSSAAIRQAEYRLRLKERNALRHVDNERNNVTEDSSAYIARAGARVFPVGISNEIPKLDTPRPSDGPQEKKSEPKRSSGTALPEDWTPPEELFAYGAEHGLSRSQTAEILEDMRIWAVANRNRAIARKADWNLTAKGFIRRDAAKFKARAGPPTQFTGTKKTEIMAFYEQLCEDTKGHGKQAESEVIDGNVLGVPVVRHKDGRVQGGVGELFEIRRGIWPGNR